MGKRLLQISGAAVLVLGAVIGSVATAPPSFANVSSGSEAGYGGFVPAGYAVATANVKIPTITCPVSGFSSASITMNWSGGGGGTHPTQADVGITIRCFDGALEFDARAEVFDPAGFSVKYLNV